MSAAAALFTLHVFSAASYAQSWDRMTNPKSTFTVTRAPEVVFKGTTRIAVLELTGPGACGPELTERLSQLISRSRKFELLDRSSIAQVVNEQDFQNSGAVAPDKAVRVGALLGPVAVFTGRITRCNSGSSEPLRSGTEKDRRGVVHQKYVVRSTAQITAAIRLVDMTTGKVVARLDLVKADTAENVALDGFPEAPSVEGVLDRTYEKITSAIAPLILPGAEVVSVVVFDDNKCDLKTSAQQIKAGQIAVALETLQHSIGGSCGDITDKNLLAKAYYNLGLALMYSGRPVDGLNSLERSSAMRPSGITDEAIANVNKMMRLNAQRIDKEANAVELGLSSLTQEVKNTESLITNKEVTELVKARMPDAVIISKIKNSPCKFDISPTALIALKTAGASDVVLLEVSDSGAKRCR